MWFQTISLKVRAYRTQLTAAVQEKRRQRAVALRLARPQLKELEPRIVPATNQWIGPAGGFWSVPGNWSLGHTPQSTEQLITSGTPSTDNLASVSVISWDNSAAITIGAGNSISGQQYISDKGSLAMMPGSKIASDNWVYEYGTVSAMGGPMGGTPFATVTISSPTVLLETGSTVTATGSTTSGSPDLLIQGTVEQYGALNAGSPTISAGTISIVGAYTINASGVTTINAGSTLSYSGSSPLYDQGAINMKGGTLTANLIYLYGLIHSEATDTITGSVEVHGGTLEVDTTIHTLGISGNLDMPNGNLDLIITGGGGNSAVTAGGSITLGNGSSAPTLNITAVTPLTSSATMWTLLTGGSISGDFGTKNLPQLPPPPPTLAWTTVNTGINYVLSEVVVP